MRPMGGFSAYICCGIPERPWWRHIGIMWGNKTLRIGLLFIGVGFVLRDLENTQINLLNTIRRLEKQLANAQRTSYTGELKDASPRE